MHTKSQAAGAAARLKAEIALNRPFRGEAEVAFLALVWTWERLEALARDFFPRHGITAAQFNALMILWDHRDRPLRQHEVARLLVVNRATAGGVIARIEKAGWIDRVVDPADSRARLVRISKAGIAKLKGVRGPYYRVIARLFPRAETGAMRFHVEYLERLRERLAALPESGAG
jgi:DNA-binding MarR family transcriptional regulator